MKKNFFLLLSIVFFMIGCSKDKNESSTDAITVPAPPFNNFEPIKSNVPAAAAVGVASGATLGAVVSPGSVAVGAITGGLIGGATKAMDAMSKESPAALMNQLPGQHIQVVQDGDTITLIVPTDIYYLPDSYEFDDVWYRGLEEIVQLVLKTKTNQMVYVAGFSDGGVGSPSAAKKLSQQRAQQMADFLWANGVPLSQLKVQGFGARYDIADNFLIHGAAMNRRIEIQWRMC